MTYEQNDLFDQKYPDAPAYRNNDTSKAAAKAMKPSASTIRQSVLAVIALKKTDGATSKELAEILSLPYETVQPRTSELKAQGKIKDSGQRRASRAEDKMAIVWVVV